MLAGRWRRPIKVTLGNEPGRTFTLSIGVRGKEPERFTDLPLEGDEFHELHWLGFVSTAEGKAVSYLDNVRIRPAK